VGSSIGAKKDVGMLINCVAYENGHKLADIPIADIDRWLGRPQCFVWVALRDADEAELRQMQHEFGLHDLAVEDARHGHQRPKMEEYGDTLFVVLKLPELREGELEIGEVAIFVGHNFVLSVRSNSWQNFLGVRERCEREPDRLREGSGFVLYALMDAVVDRYFPLLEAMESEFEAIEEHIFERGSGRRNIERLYALKRRANELRHIATPLLEVSGRLHGSRAPAIAVPSQDYFRDVNDHLLRISSAIDSLRESIDTAIQVNLSMVTIEESEITKRLAAWAAIFAVSTALAGIWGMNFEHMPELRWEWGYPMALAVIAGAAGYLFRRFRRAGWL
jgi:magnesium transporter